ncbi:MAG: hypothetical protein QNL88_01120, partial [Acidobacteriota bacterium]|nr:hypothetical protein [Acidobacteriota bacterium]
AQLASATETRRWIVDTADGFLAGRGQGVEVTPDGTLRWVEGWSSGPSVEEPIVMAGVRAGDGSLIVGTGHPARLYRVRGAEAELLADLPAEQVTAIVVRDDGTVVLATVAPGVIYEWSGGELSEVGRLQEGGIWDLAVFAGEVVAAAGPPATLYRLADRGLERWKELPDVHARCLEVEDGRLLVGTSGKGLILSVDENGMVGVLADSPFTEISDLAVGGGSVWAAALVGEPVSTASRSNGKSAETNGAEVETEITPGTDLKLPKVNGKTATSEILQLTVDGGLLSLHRFTKEIAASVAWDGEGLLVGTGWEGEVWRFVADGGARLATVDAVQIVAVINGGEALLTQGPGGVLWRDADGARPGRFRSPTKDFKQPVRFGEYRVEPAGPGVGIRFRTGISESPDDTWLEWTEWMPAGVGQVSLPPARAVQWEVRLPPTNGDAVYVDRVEVATVEVNLPPRVPSLVVEDPGVIYLAAPPASGPVIEAVHPDANGIFTVVDESAAKNGASTKGKKYYRAGFRTVSWKAADPNRDPLQYRLEIEGRDGHHLEVRERITGTQLGIDTSAVPDGVYRFRLTASDGADNPEGALETTKLSRWFAVDNTPPTISLERTGETWLATVTDALSPIVRAEWSRDGEAWEALAPADGLLDGRDESFEFPAEDGSHLVVVRVVDRQHNRATAGTTEE